MISKSSLKEVSNPGIQRIHNQSNDDNIFNSLPVAHIIISNSWYFPSTVSMPVGATRLIKVGMNST